MGLGMARGGTTISSLPATGVGDGIDDDELPEEGEDVDDGQISAEEAEIAEAEALESEARRQGWRPLAEYRGKPGGWVDAKAFIERGKNFLPFVQKQLRETEAANNRMATEMDGLRTEMSNTRADMQKLLDFSRRANQAGYDRAVKDLKVAQREAAAAGDVTTFDKIEDQLDQMASARAEGDETPPAPAPAPAPQPRPAVDLASDYQDFLDENPWFNTDRVLNSAMIAEHNAVMEETPGMPLYEQLAAAKEAVMKRFPKKFGLSEEPPAPAPQPRRPAPPLPPRGGERRPSRPSGGDDPIESIADPRERADARQGYASAKKSMPTLTKAEYMEVFNNPHTDVLDVIDRNKPRK